MVCNASDFPGAGLQLKPSADAAGTLRAGAGMYHAKEFLVHESLDTIKHYAKLTITDLKETHRKCHPGERDKSE